MARLRGHRRPGTLRSRVVVGADGSTSLVARTLPGAAPTADDRIIAVRAYCEGVACPADRAELAFSGGSDMGGTQRGGRRQWGRGGKAGTGARAGGRGRGGGVQGASRRFGEIGQASGAIVQQAASLLDEELAAGIVAARAVQKRFQRDRHIDPEDLKGALQRFQSDGHELVNPVNEQLTALRSDQNAAVMHRLVDNAHGLLDRGRGCARPSAWRPARRWAAASAGRSTRRGRSSSSTTPS